MTLKFYHYNVPYMVKVNMGPKMEEVLNVLEVRKD